jgi:O-antigen/teichoic acid export membrane protein
MPETVVAKAPRMRTNFSWTLAGNIGYSAAQWATLVLLAHLTSPEVVGGYALAQAVALPAFTLTNLQLRAIQATDAADVFSFRHYLELRAGTTALAILIVLAIGAIVYPQILLVIAGVGAARAVESICDILYGALQRAERMRPIAISMVVRSTIGLVLFAIALRLTRSLEIAVFALAAGWLCALIFLDAPIVRHTLRAPHRSDVAGKARHRELLLLALPLGVSLLLLTLQANIPRYFLEARGGTAAVGVFAALASLLVPGNTIAAALGGVAVPRLARYYEQGELKQYRALAAKLLGIGAVLGLGGFLVAVTFARPLLLLVFGAEYAKHDDVFVVLMLGGIPGLTASLAGVLVTSARQFRSQLVVNATVMVALLAACTILIPRYGLTGAAWALNCAALLVLIGFIVLIWRALDAATRALALKDKLVAAETVNA